MKNLNFVICALNWGLFNTIICQCILSVNQTTVQIKIQKTWKVSRDPNYPINLMKTTNTGKEESTKNVRASTRKVITEGSKRKTAESSPIRDAGKLWNQAPKEIKNAPTQEIAKIQIRIYCKTLPT